MGGNARTQASAKIVTEFRGLIRRPRPTSGCSSAMDKTIWSTPTTSSSSMSRQRRPEPTTRWLQRRPWSIAPSGASRGSLSGLPPTPPTGRASSLAGSSTTKGSRRTSRSGRRGSRWHLLTRGLHLGQAAWPLRLSQRQEALHQRQIATGVRCSTEPRSVTVMSVL